MLRPSPALFEGICSLFDLYLLHTFVTFAEVDLAGFYSEQGISKVLYQTDSDMKVDTNVIITPPIYRSKFKSKKYQD